MENKNVSTMCSSKEVNCLSDGGRFLLGTEVRSEPTSPKLCKRFVVSMCWSVDVLVCRSFGLSTCFGVVDVSVC